MNPLPARTIPEIINATKRFRLESHRFISYSMLLKALRDDVPYFFVDNLRRPHTVDGDESRRLSLRDCMITAANPVIEMIAGRLHPVLGEACGFSSPLDFRNLDIDQDRKVGLCPRRRDTIHSSNFLKIQPAAVSLIGGR